MNLGERIVKFRKDNKMSQDDLAEVFNVTRQTVSNWENSKNYPDIETLIQFSDKFHISLDALLKGDKEMVYKMDQKMKNAKIFKIVTLILLLILLFVSVIFGLNYRIKKERERKEEQKYNTLMKNIDELGFEKDGIGFAFIKEDGFIYRVFINRPLPEQNSISANTITFRDEEAISAEYDGKIVKVTYLNENKATVYCDQFGNLFNEAQNKNSIEIYDKYQDRTISIATRMVELFDNIYR